MPTLYMTIVDGSGNPLPGIAAVCIVSGVSTPLTSDANGSITIPDIESGSQITVTPEDTAYVSFSPVQLSQIMQSDTSIGFVAVPFQIQGQVWTDPSQNGGNPNVEGATITLSGNFADGSTSKTIQTDVFGAFSFSCLVQSGEYQFLVLKSGWTTMTGNFTINYPNTSNPLIQNIAFGQNQSDGSSDDTWQWAVAFAVSSGLSVLCTGASFASLIIALRAPMKGAASEAAACSAASAAPADSVLPGGPALSLADAASAPLGSPAAVDLDNSIAAAVNQLYSQSGASAANAVLGGPPSDFDAAEALAFLNEFPARLRCGLTNEALLQNPAVKANLEAMAEQLDGTLISPPTASGFDASAFLEAGADLASLADGAASDGSGFSLVVSGSFFARAVEEVAPGLAAGEDLAETLLIAADLALVC